MSLRLIHRAAYKLIFTWWFLRRPRTKGVQLVVSNAGKILLVRHTYMQRSQWAFPGGRMKKGETPEAAAIREANEELGTRLNRHRELRRTTIYHSFHHDDVFIFAGSTDADAVHASPVEIAEVGWFEPRDMPPNMTGFAKRILSEAKLKCRI